MRGSWPVGKVALLAAWLPLAACGEEGPSITGTSVDPSISLVKIGGDNQSDTVLSTLALPLRVLVAGRARPLPHVLVRWFVGGTPAVISETDLDGIASMTWTLGSQAGEWSTAVTVDGPDSVWVRFAATALPGQPVALEKTSGDGQLGAAGEPLPSRYEVTAEDAYGNLALLDPDDVAWMVVSGSGSLERACPVTCLPQTSSVVHTLGPEEGRHEVTATLESLSVTFGATAVTALVALRAYRCGRGACPPPGRFDPDSVEVGAGGTVGWTWSGTHELAFDDGWAPPMDAPEPSPGSYVRPFTAPGTYRFRCTLHSTDFAQGEVGVVVVSQ